MRLDVKSVDLDGLRRLENVAKKLLPCRERFRSRLLANKLCFPLLVASVALDTMSLCFSILSLKSTSVN